MGGFSRRRTVHAVSRLALALGLSGTCTLGCDREDDVERVRVADSRNHWTAQNFVEMVPPIRLPSRSPRHRTRVFLRLPDAGILEVRPSARAKRAVLVFPAGTESVRVEEVRDKAGEFVAEDVRGTRLGEPERFFVLRRVDRSTRGLSGFEWTRGDTEQNARATERLVGLLTNAGVNRSTREHARLNNDCASCHPREKPANERFRQHGLVNRATDGSGLYQPQTVFDSSVPIETYHPREPNTADPFISYFCPSGADVHAQPSRVRCADGTVPWGRLDVPSAVAAEDERVARLCKARHYLFERLTPAGKRHFASQMAECTKPKTRSPRGDK